LGHPVYSPTLIHQSPDGYVGPSFLPQLPEVQLAQSQLRIPIPSTSTSLLPFSYFPSLLHLVMLSSQRGRDMNRVVEVGCKKTYAFRKTFKNPEFSLTITLTAENCY